MRSWDDHLLIKALKLILFTLFLAVGSLILLLSAWLLLNAQSLTGDGYPLPACAQRSFPSQHTYTSDNASTALYGCGLLPDGLQSGLPDGQQFSRRQGEPHMTTSKTP